MATTRRRRRPEGSTWGGFGPDDGRGRLNLLGPSHVRAGLEAARSGAAFPLGLPITVPGGSVLNPHRHPPALRPSLRGDEVTANRPAARTTPGAPELINDDVLTLYPQYSSQWDALGHVGCRFDAGDGEPSDRYYNGYRPADLVLPEREEDAGPGGETTVDLGPVGIGNAAAVPVQGRGVLVDLAYHLGTGRRAVGYADVARILEADGIEVREGDFVLFHTGFAERLLGMAGKPDREALDALGARLDGRDPGLLRWLEESGVVAVIADNYAVENYPAPPSEGDPSILPLHVHCLFRLGIHLGELWRLSPLAEHLRAEGRFEFLLTAQPLNIPGAAGSPVNAVATT
ncbi:cyclase family protein [Corynebacterium otitidis]|uniref:cyclase family protein n=1 Tax=Corynebacterium otitidis TaxID=29321 RepID=UPI000627D458|nr:cyclase family protein [Corynebacterium otitidis]KKO83761.1 cyclase [Corynebacterium otitidis]